MTREIKFRAWDVNNQKFIYLELLTGVFHPVYSHELLEKGQNLSSWSQYTGLKDKTGKEIYEGDCFMDEEDGTYDYVIWNKVSAGWTTNIWYSVGEFAEQAPTLEIIGNIYENPELIKRH